MSMTELTFEPHVKLLRAKVTQKLFAIKKIFYLSNGIKLHFFKTFILPHFRYSTFCFKILNKIILKDFFSDSKPNLNVKNTRCKTRNIFNVSRSLTVKSGKRLSIHLPQLVNINFKTQNS
jgi:hypothetical protein